MLALETSPAVNLKNEAVLVPHATAGAELSFRHVVAGAEAQVGALASYQVFAAYVF